MENLKRELQEVIALYQEVMDEVKTDEKLTAVFEGVLTTIREKIQQLREEITVIEKVSGYLPENYFNEKELFVAPSDNSPNNLLAFLLSIVKFKINELSTTLVDNGPQITKEALKIVLRRKFASIKDDIIASVQDAVVHYYTGNGRPVLLGIDTVDKIKQSEDIQQYKAKIEKGLIANPASGAGIPIDIQADDTSLASCLGQMTLRYEITCDDDSCTITYTVEGNGFRELNNLNENLTEDSGSPDDKLEGTPYNYEAVTWSETLPNPGYPVKDGKPLPIKK